MEIRVLVRGDRACFKRPEFAHDLISYDVMTPFAARGLFGSIFRDPNVHWVIDEIRILRPIRFTWMALAEAETRGFGGPLPVRIAGPADRRIACVLSDVAYLITGHIDPAHGAEPHYTRLRRAAAATHRSPAPFLGLRGFVADIELHDDEAEPIHGAYDGTGAIDLGWMLYDTEREARGGMRLYRPTMTNGVIDLRRRDALILAG